MSEEDDSSDDDNDRSGMYDLADNMVGNVFEFKLSQLEDRVDALERKVGGGGGRKKKRTLRRNRKSNRKSNRNKRVEEDNVFLCPLYPNPNLSIV
jgi:hypothetical protein